MKPTQQETLWVALRAGMDVQVDNLHRREPYWTATMSELQKLIELALERFGAGGGEPSRDMPHGWVTNWPALNGGTRPVYHASAIKPKYGPELDNSLVSYPVFTRPGSSPTDLRAEYLRGLEDAAGICDRFQHRDVGMQPAECASAIRALKGKQ